MAIKVSKGFTTQLAKLKEDGVIAMPEVSKLRKTALREIDKGDRLEATKAYEAELAKLDGTPKNKQTQTFLATVKEEFKDRVEGEQHAAKLRDFFSRHFDRVPADLKAIFDFASPQAFRVAATGGQGTGARELDLDVPTKGGGRLPDGTAKKLLDFIASQPELEATAKALKSSQWGGAQLWVRSSLDPNKLGWSTESATHAFEQAQHPTSLGGVKIAPGELGDIIQALYNVNIVPEAGDGNTPEWTQAKKEFVAAFRKADAAGHVSDEVRKRFDELVVSYKLPV